MSWEIPSGAVFNNTTQGADFCSEQNSIKHTQDIDLYLIYQEREKQNNEKLGLSKLVSLIPSSLIIEAI